MSMWLVLGAVAIVAVVVGWQRQKSGASRRLTKGGQPSVELWVGPPGNGKSNYANNRIEEFLLYDNRPINTTLKVRVMGWHDYMVKKYNFHDVPERLFYLEPEQARAFMDFRGKQFNPFEETTEKKLSNRRVWQSGRFFQKEVEYINFAYRDPVESGCIYILDEVHKDFRARETGKTPARLLEYLSQCRQFGDRIIAITQHPKNLDVCFTRIADRFCTFTNTGKRKLFGLGFPRSFIRNDYGDSTMKSNSHEGFAVSGFNKEVSELYETAAAGGGAADMGEKDAKIVNVPVIMMLCLLVLFLGVWYLPRWYMREKSKPVQIAAVKMATNMVGQVERRVVVRPVPVVNRPPVVPDVVQHEIHVVSWMTVNGHDFVVKLSDGFVFRAQGVEGLNGLDLGGVTLGYPDAGGRVPVTVRGRRPVLNVAPIRDKLSDLLGKE